MSEESGGDRRRDDRSDDPRFGDRRSGDDADGRPAERDGDADDRERGIAADAAATEDDEEHEPSVAGVFGARPEDAPPRPEIVPESPDLENALFVLVGVLFGLFVIYRAIVVFTA